MGGEGGRELHNITRERSIVRKGTLRKRYLLYTVTQDLLTKRYSIATLSYRNVDRACVSAELASRSAGDVADNHTYEP